MASPMNSLIVPRWLQDHRGHRAQVPVEQPDHLLGAEALGEPGEAAQVRHQDGDGPDLAAEAHGAAVPDALLRQLGADVAPQHVPDEVAIAEALHHLGHGPGERADLVPAPGHDGDVEIALADAPRLGAELAERLGNPAHEHDAAQGGESQRQKPQTRGPPRLRLDGGGVVALGHHHGCHPLPVPHRKRRRPAEVPLAAPLERVSGGRARAQAFHDLADERGVLPRRPPGGVDAARRRDEKPVPGGDEHAAARRHAEIAHEPGQAGEREVHGEDPAHRAGRVQERHRTGDAEPSVVEAIGLGPRHIAPRRGQAKERLLPRAIAMVGRLAHPLPPAVGQDAILLEPDPAALGKAPVQVELAGAIVPGSHEAIGPVSVADPAQPGIRAQDPEGVFTERPEIVRGEESPRHEARAEPHRALGVAEELRGVVGRHARGLRHRVVDEGARPGVLLSPRQGSERGAGRRRQQHDQADQRERDRRPTEGAAREWRGAVSGQPLRHGTSTLLSFRERQAPSRELAGSGDTPLDGSRH